MIDHARAQSAVRELLIALGQDPDREGLLDTPARVARAWAEMLSGDDGKADEILARTFDADGFDQIVALSDIPFYSTCEHHMLPFFGRCHVGYIATNKVLGASKLARITNCFARRLQIQERLTVEIADALQRELQPRGVAVVIRASHACMTTRGVHVHGSAMLTRRLLGAFEREPWRSDILASLSA